MILPSWLPPAQHNTATATFPVRASGQSLYCEARLFYLSADYEHAGYGKASVRVEGDGLILEVVGIEFPLAHYHYDLFMVPYDLPPSADAAGFGGVRVRFDYDDAGAINVVSVPNRAGHLADPLSNGPATDLRDTHDAGTGANPLPHPRPARDHRPVDDHRRRLRHGQGSRRVRGTLRELGLAVRRDHHRLLRRRHGAVFRAGEARRGVRLQGRGAGTLVGPFWWLVDVLILSMMMLVIAVMTAAIGEVLQQTLGIPKPLSLAFALVCVGFLSWRGSGFIEKAKTWGSPLCIWATARSRCWC